MNAFDLSDFYDDNFHEDAIININNSQSEIKVIFMNEYERNAVGIMNFEGSNPMAIASSFEIEGVKSNRDYLIYKDKEYRITEVKPQSDLTTIMELALD